MKMTTIPTSGCLVNHGQSKISSDGLARIHRLSPNQPVACRLYDCNSENIVCVASEQAAIAECDNRGISYKKCEHCWR